MLVSLMNQNRFTLLKNGIHEINHFNLDILIPVNLDFDEKYPDLGEFYSYGVCDHFSQILEQCPILESSKERAFVVSVTEINKSEEPSSGGWRWHKWGSYIGTHEITTEYLYDEPVVETVYCYHIYEVTNHIPNLSKNNNRILKSHFMIEGE